MTRLEDSSASVIGKCSPTKKVAGRASSTRNSTRCALCTMLKVLEKLAVAPGSVARKSVAPPPNAMSGGMPAAAPPSANPFCDPNIALNGLEKRARTLCLLQLTYDARAQRKGTRA